MHSGTGEMLLGTSIVLVLSAFRYALVMPTFSQGRYLRDVSPLLPDLCFLKLEHNGHSNRVF